MSNEGLGMLINGKIAQMRNIVEKYQIMSKSIEVSQKVALCCCKIMGTLLAMQLRAISANNCSNLFYKNRS